MKIDVIEMTLIIVHVILTSQRRDPVADIVPRTQPCPDMEHIHCGGTNGDEGNIHPGSYLQRIQLGVGSHNLQYYSCLHKPLHSLYIAL